MTTTTFNFSTFQSTYKYKIGGEYDSLLARFGTIKKDDDQGFRNLRNARQNEAVKIAQIKTEEPDENIAKGKIAKVKIDFLERASREVTRAFLFSSTSGVSAKSISLGVSGIISELRTLTKDYVENTTDSVEEQDAFIARLQKTIDKVESLTYKTKANLRAEGQYLASNLVSSKRLIRESRELIDNFLAARGGAAAATTSTDGGLDITV